MSTRKRRVQAEATLNNSEAQTLEPPVRYVWYVRQNDVPKDTCSPETLKTVVETTANRMFSSLAR